jgi:xanthosine utilization system XapX-like protein
MSPLFKNVLLSFAAAFVGSLALALSATPEPGPDAIKAFVIAGLYAGGRAVIGALKESFSGTPFKVDTEA